MGMYKGIVMETNFGPYSHLPGFIFFCGHASSYWIKSKILKINSKTRKWTFMVSPRTRFDEVGVKLVLVSFGKP